MIRIQINKYHSYLLKVYLLSLVKQTALSLFSLLIKFLAFVLNYYKITYLNEINYFNNMIFVYRE